MVILNDKKAVDDLLVKTSAATANRPVQTFANLCGFDKFLSGMQDGPDFRHFRKMIKQEMSKNCASKWSGVQDVESRRLLLRTLEAPQNLIDHFKTQSSAIILKIIYGYAIKPHGTDELVKLIEVFMHQISDAYVPFSRWIDIIPWLQYLPEWFPGADSKKIAREWRETSEAVVNKPYDAVLEQMKDTGHPCSYVSSLIQKHGGVTGLVLEDRDAIKWTAAIMYGGGFDTTSSVLTCFLLAMVLNPKVQEKAQKEIDALISRDFRLPELEDKEKLGYVVAIVKECHRWFPIVPMGQGHVTTKELEYRGYRIPKGSLLRTCRRSFLHDSTVYQDPGEFKPERFLERSEPDPSPDQFGYGRRTCPGQSIASNTLFITIARVLATMHISRAKDEHGRELKVEVQSRPGIIDCPEPFPYNIRPRSDSHAELIRGSLTKLPTEN